MYVQDIPSDFSRRIQSAYLDALYAFLDGLVHVAFSDPETIFTTPEKSSARKNLPGAVSKESEDGRSKEVDIRNVVRSCCAHH